MRSAGLAFAVAIAAAASAPAQTLNDYLGGWAFDAAGCANRGPEVVVIGEAKRGLAFWYTGVAGRPSVQAVAAGPVAKVSLPVKSDKGDKSVDMSVSGGALTIANPAGKGDVDIAGGTLPDGESVTLVACDSPNSTNQAYWADCAGVSSNGVQFPPSAVERACTGLIDAGIRDPKRLSEAYRYRSIARRNGGNGAGALLDATAAAEFDPASAEARNHLDALAKDK
jgi:hypothetical protein